MANGNMPAANAPDTMRATTSQSRLGDTKAIVLPSTPASAHTRITRAAWPKLTEKSAASAGSMASVARSDAMLAKQHAPSRKGMFEALTFKLRMLHQLAPPMLSPQDS